MGWVRDTLEWFGFSPRRTVELSESAPRPIDQVILEFAGRGASAKVGRTEALSVPAVQKGRNQICSISTLPLLQYGPDRRVVKNPLFLQLDPDVANVVTLAQTLEDLLFDGISWWRITGFGWDGYPVRVRHLDVSAVSLDPPGDGKTPAPLPSGWDPRDAVVWVDGKPVPGKEMIRFDSPNPPVLKVGARAIRRALLLDSAAAMYADDPRPQDYFSPADGADPIEDDEIKGILAKWKAWRKKRATGYVPASLKYNTVESPSPADLQLVELQKQVTIEIANALGVDPEDLGVSTTSRTYANAVDRRRDRINDVLSTYMRAITDRLSMGDVTKRGHSVQFDLDDYMRANPTERVAYYKAMKEMDALTPEEIREEERLPALKTAPATPAVAPVVPLKSVDAAGDPAGVALAEAYTPPASVAAAFAGDEDGRLHFADLPMVSFSVNKSSRTIEGLALPYGPIVTKYGLKFRFMKGALRWNKAAVSRVKLLRDHDMRQPLGTAVKMTDGPSGLHVKFKVASGADGDRALALASEGVLDGLSAGVDFDMSRDAEADPNNDGVMLVRRADLREVSLTAMPAFDDARVTKVAASRADEGETVADDDTTTTSTATAVDTPTPQPAGLTLSDDQVKALLTRPGALDALFQTQAVQKPATPEGTFTLSAEQLDTLIRSGGLPMLFGMPAAASGPQAVPEQRQVVDPTRKTTATTAVTAVSEPLPYRFDRAGNLTRGVQYDFSSDLISGSRGDGEAMDRAHKFLQHMSPVFTRAEFDVDKADAAALNPNIQRPDLYVDQKDFSYPIWDAISKGTIDDATPFVLPKFNAAAGLVAGHTEAVEPTPGSFSATSQTITPSPNSGKVEITREAWDQGGNPQLSGLVWRQMQKAWFESLEASAVATLDALSPTQITLAAGSADDVLVDAVEAALASLQFVRGGLRMRDFFIQVDLYKALAAAADSTGRKLLPRIGAVNANGQVSDFFADLDVAGLRGRPSWALAASGSVPASSYLFDRMDVSGWATAPQRLEFQYRVAFVDVAIWGYKALANTDLTGVREFVYDPVA